MAGNNQRGGSTDQAADQAPISVPDQAANPSSYCSAHTVPDKVAIISIPDQAADPISYCGAYAITDTVPDTVAVAIPDQAAYPSSYCRTHTVPDKVAVTIPDQAAYDPPPDQISDSAPS